MILSAIISVIAGFLIGVLAGLLGIGGGMILVVLFNVGYGMPALQSTGTTLFTVIPTSLSGSIAHIKGKTCILGVGIASGIGGAMTSPLGVWLSSLSPEWLVLISCAMVIAYASVTMLRKAFALKKKVEEDGQPDDPKDDSRYRFTKALALKGVCIGLLTGVLSGYVGLGGGFIMIPLFMGILKLPMKLTSGTSLIAVMILAIPAAVTHAVMGNIDWLVGICVSIGSIPGAIIGARLVKRVSELVLRFGFAIFLLVAAVLLAVKQFI